jgi:hypothetical protein
LVDCNRRSAVENLAEDTPDIWRDALGLSALVFNR